VHQRSIVEQIEIGIDAPDLPTALRSALRQAPDVMVVGEMRDPETTRIALAAAETGHLVFATLHATDSASAISRIADTFSAEHQNAVRQQLATAVSAVLTQTLLPTLSGALVPAAELLMVNYGARQHIRTNALQHLHQEIAITRKAGSFTFEESLGSWRPVRSIGRGAPALVRVRSRCMRVASLARLGGTRPTSYLTIENVVRSGRGRGFAFCAVGGTGSFFVAPIERRDAFSDRAATVRALIC
jgi:hypothetical protein